MLELARQSRARVVLGNHEDALLSSVADANLDRVRAELGKELDEWMAWIRTWPLMSASTTANPASSCMPAFARQASRVMHACRVNPHSRRRRDAMVRTVARS